MMYYNYMRGSLYEKIINTEIAKGRTLLEVLSERNRLHFYGKDSVAGREKRQNLLEAVKNTQKRLRDHSQADFAARVRLGDQLV